MLVFKLIINTTFFFTKIVTDVFNLYLVLFQPMSFKGHPSYGNAKTMCPTFFLCNFPPSSYWWLLFTLCSEASLCGISYLE